MARRSVPFLPIPLLALLLVGQLVWGGGCARQRENWYDGIHDLSGVPVSADLAPALEAGVASLAGPGRSGPVVDDLELYTDLSARLKAPGTRDAAGDEVYALWETEPTSVLWLELAKNQNYRLRRTADLRRMCGLSALSDTTTAYGAYVAGRLRYGQGDRGEMYRLAETRMADLDSLQRIWLVRKLAFVDDESGDPLGGARRLIRWLPAARRLGGRQLEGPLWSDLAVRLEHADRLDDALQAAVLAAAMARAAGQEYWLLSRRILIAGLMGARRESEAALARLDELAEEAADRGHTWLLQESLDGAAEICASLGDHRRTLELDLRNLALCRAQSDSLNLPRSLASVAHDYRMLGELDSCRVHLERARDVVAAFGDRRNLARIKVLLAKYYLHAGRYDVADSLFAAARGASGTAGTEVDEARALVDLVQQALEMGRPELAYGLLARLRQLTDTMRDRGLDQNLRADFELVTAELLAHQGEFQPAAAALARAEEAIASRGGEGRLWEHRRCSGELALLREDLAAAREAFAACLELAEGSGNETLTARSRFLLGSVLLEEGRYGEARALFRTETADSSFGHPFRTRLSSRLFLGLTHAREGRHAEAAAIFRRTLDGCTPHSPADLVARIKIALGRSLAVLGRPREAEPLLREALDALDGSGELSYVEELRAFQADGLRDAGEVLIGLYVDQPALAGRDDLGRLTLGIGERCLRPVPSTSAPPAFAPPRPGAGSPWLAFLVGRDRSFAWTIAGDGVRIATLPGRDGLRRLAAPVLADMTRPARDPDPAAAGRLSAVLLAPVADLWAAGGLLTVVPDGILHDVPWAALPWPPVAEGGAARESGTMGTSRPLLEHGPVAEVSGLADAGPDRARDRPPPDPRGRALLAIGCDDAGAAGSGPRLRRAEEEARRIAALWTAGEAELRLGPAASWAELEALPLLRYGVIHLATHAEVYHGLPRRSTLRLAADADSPPVTIPAVRELELDAGLVFLSCCNAARRLSPAGGGVDDFARAFADAGARTVVASTLWVDDAASAHLAGRFYHHWLEGASRADALRAAQQDLRAARAEWSHPAYWAFYRLIGDPR